MWTTPAAKKVLAANNYRRNDPEWVYEKLGVGDVVYRDYDGHTHQEGAYIQGEMSLLDKRLNLVLSGSLSNTGYQRIDHFYYDKEHEKSPTHNFMEVLLRQAPTIISTATTMCSSMWATYPAHLSLAACSFHRT